jgi:hypothetical protein
MSISIFKNSLLESFAVKNLGEDLAGAVNLTSVKAACDYIKESSDIELYIPSNEQIEESMVFTKAVVAVVNHMVSNNEFDEHYFELSNFFEKYEHCFRELNRVGVDKISDTQILIAFALIFGESVKFNIIETDESEILSFVSLPDGIEQTSEKMDMFNK